MTTRNIPTTRSVTSHARDARADDLSQVERALEWLSRNFERQPSLAEAASHAGLSEYHFQRRFRRQVGLSPKKYVQFLTLERAKQMLAQSCSVLDAACASGLSGPGRLHDLFVNVEAMTPGEYKSRGQGLVIRYGAHHSPFGRCLVMRTARGVCGLAFASRTGCGEPLAKLTRGFEAATFVEDARATAGTVKAIFGESTGGGDIALHLRGTPFQIKVWRALLTIPPGCVASYRDLANRIGAPGASRAVGNAVGSNPVAWIIPCHRVIRASGVLGEYRWGGGRKLAMLSLETGGATRGSRDVVSADQGEARSAHVRGDTAVSRFEL